jgi:imidazolonepropionase
MRSKKKIQKTTKSKTKSKPASDLKLFRNIDTLLTLEDASAKAARNIFEKDLSALSRAAFISENGKIVWVGSEKTIPKELSKSKVKEFDLGGSHVIPAFVECHTHLAFAGDRADEFEWRNQGQSYQEIAKKGGGILNTIKPTRESSEEELAMVAQARANDFVRQGVTTLEAKSGYGLTLKDELKILRASGGLRGPRIVRTYLGPHAVPAEQKSAASYIDEIIKTHLPKVKEEGLACRVDIFVENGYFNAELAEKYLLEARKLGFDITVHADQLSRCGGVDLAIKMGAKSADHLLCISDSDISALARSKTTCVLLPAADLYLNCPYPPARKLIDAGARVALATDFNPGSSPTRDLSLIGVLARAQMKMTLPEVISAYTLGGAYALGLEPSVGSIEVGKACDFLVLSADWDRIFYAIGVPVVAQTWREGRQIS